MNTPPFLLAAALLFWGWQTGHVIIGLLAGLALEAPRVVKFRWSLEQNDFNRLWNISMVLFVAVGTFLIINEGSSLADLFGDFAKRPEAFRQTGRAALTWFQWLPIIFLPFTLAVAFNERRTVATVTFSWWLRRAEKRDPEIVRRREYVHIAYPYLAICLLGASAVTERNPFFYWGVAALVAWALWPLRTRRYSVASWGALFAVVVALGYFGHHGLAHLQKKLEEMNVAWFSRFAALGFDPREARTQLGTIGKIKLSDQIVLRLRTDGGPPPEYLRETSYNLYRPPVWAVPKREFAAVPAETDGTTWKLLERKPVTRTLQVGGYFRRGQGLLPLPFGTAEIGDLLAGEVATNHFGGARMQGGPGLALFHARYDGGTSIDTAPNAEDFQKLASEPAMARIAAELGLHDRLPPQEALRRVGNYFASEFSYATYLGREHVATSNETALARFLLHTRAGHCEYFATATTLLLRHAGLPTRYAVGYAVQEGSGRKFVVRARHAHAWTLVYFDGTWHDFDTTPAGWNAVESQRQSRLQPVKDFFSGLWFEVSKLRWGKTEWRKYLMLAPLPVLALLIGRFILGKQWRKMRAQQKARALARDRQGLDSEFYLIEKHLAARGLERHAHESWAAWLRRISAHEQRVGELRRALLLHERHRFDPRGLSAEERAELRQRVSDWLAAQR